MQGCNSTNCSVAWRPILFIFAIDRFSIVHAQTTTQYVDVTVTPRSVQVQQQFWCRQCTAL